ncbi:MAG TPA: hypothetical protein VKE22_04365 [Haliangiales bacterium]|nr:hypothetical protein [Haliangiales bacterium]
MTDPQPNAALSRWLGLLVVGLCTALGWTHLLQAHGARDASFLLHYVAKQGQQALAFLRIL